MKNSEDIYKLMTMQITNLEVRINLPFRHDDCKVSLASISSKSLASLVSVKLGKESYFRHFTGSLK